MSENENVIKFPSPVPSPAEVSKPFVRITWWQNGKVEIERNASAAPSDNGDLIRFLGSLNYCVWALTEWANHQATVRGLEEAALSEFLANLPDGVQH